MRVLIANLGGDVANLAELAKRRGWQVTYVHTSEDAKLVLQDVEFQLVFTCIGKPADPAFLTLKIIGSANLNSPVICVLSNDCPIDRARAWQLGALVCLTESTSQTEIEMAALSAIRFSHSLKRNTISRGCIELDIERSELRINDNLIVFPPRQYRLIERLIMNQGHTVTREQLFSHLYGIEDFPNPKIIDVMICKIRSRFEELGVNSEALRTVWGVGYCFDFAKMRTEQIKSQA